MTQPFEGLPKHHFGVILVDPPWRFLSRTPAIGDRDPRNHSGTMDRGELLDLPVRTVAAKDCHLFMWVTGPMLPEAVPLMEAWGFHYSGIAFTWVKLRKAFGTRLGSRDSMRLSDFHTGLGYTTRKNTELCLLGRRGAPVRVAKDVRELVIAPRRQHSRKPDEIYERIEQYADGPYLELFACQERDGWTAWGHQIGKFKALPADPNTSHEANMGRAKVAPRREPPPANPRRGAASKLLGAAP